MQEAKYYKRLPNQAVECQLCPHQCHLEDGQTGKCRVRTNTSGKLHTQNFGNITALALDSVEKKPLYHFFPAHQILSIGTNGCNLSCEFCKNFQFSQKPKKAYYTRKLKPEELAELSQRHQNNIGVAFTYNEPVIFYEYMLASAKLIKQHGGVTAMVTNGFINKNPLQELLPYIDAFNVDLKSFSNNFYEEKTGSMLPPVLETIKQIHKAQKHLELTFLLIPKLNDQIDGFKKMIKWIKDELASDVPLHISRYFPSNKMAEPATPIDLLYQFKEIADQHLQYTYIGNVENEKKACTYCPNCNELIICRQYSDIVIVGLTPNGNCSNCDHKILKYTSYDSSEKTNCSGPILSQ